MKPKAAARPLTTGLALIGVYALIVLAAILVIPLHLGEILQLMGASSRSVSTLMGWVAQTPASAPLNYFVQWPFVLIGGHSRLPSRLPSLVFAIGASYVFLRLAERIHVRARYLALALFMLLPLHYEFATEARPIEQALFLLTLATYYFLRLTEAPDFPSAGIYSLLLLLAVYTEPSSYLPALGYLLFLLRFAIRAQHRRVIWFALPATILPPLLFLPYYFWAHPQANPDWLFEQSAYPPDLPLFLQAIYSIGMGQWNGYIVGIVLIAGAVAGAWVSFRAPVSATPKAVTLFWLFGGVVTTFGIAMAIDAWRGYSFAPTHALWAAPGAIILLFAALEFYMRSRTKYAWALPVALLVLCCISDLRYLTYHSEDLPAEAALVHSELTGDSCLVFVSEHLSRSLFTLFDPSLQSHECQNFFHKRIVLASHPYVRPDQQEDAESYFRGLNFIEKKRIRAGGGQIIVFETQ